MHIAFRSLKGRCCATAISNITASCSVEIARGAVGAAALHPSDATLPTKPKDFAASAKRVRALVAIIVTSLFDTELKLSHD